MQRPTPPSGIPKFAQLIPPTIYALRSLGGSAGIEELGEAIISALGLPEKVVAYRRNGAATNEVLYRAAWARTYLRRDHCVETTSRGVWALTPRGRDITDQELSTLPSRVRRQSNRGPEHVEPRAIDDAIDDVIGWKEQLLTLLRGLQPDAFERLSQRVLRESGFIKVEVTGRTGDGGSDGVGVLRIQLISFQVLFQCKRYRDTVGASAIRDFRGAMVGRTDKGLFITTGRFTSEAKREATRDGAPPIELIDGEEFCELLKQLRIGVTTETIERVVIRSDILNAI